MSLPIIPLVLALVFFTGLAAGVYAVLLWNKLSRLEGKMDSLKTNCDFRQKDMESRFLSRLEHEVEHQGLWEALHHHEHDFRGRVRR
ncbi:MAG: hypothetical protein ACUVXF_12390 [Desulfobaccales bacterium]